jgi:branched-chain amino acid transport system permease protein
MFLQQIINGLTVGAVYALIALGYTMVYGILQLINFAHGEIYMIGAYLAIIFIALFTAIGLTATNLSISIVFTAILTILFCSAYGFAVEKVAYKPLRHAPRLSPLISAIGVSIFLQNYVMLTQGATDKVFPIRIGEQVIEVLGIGVSYLQVFILIASSIIMLTLHIFIKRTRLGKAMRATAQDKTMASLVGIDIDNIISITFIIGAALAAISGIIVSFYYGLINYSIGYIAGIKAFTAAVLGGIGNIPGAMLGGIILGLIESMGAAYISSEYKDAFAFIVLIMLLLIRPSGILGKKIEEKV